MLLVIVLPHVDKANKQPHLYLHVGAYKLARDTSKGALR